MRLLCRFIQSTEEPSFVFWYHEDVMISFDQYRGISTFKNKTGSSLTISTINHSHSGNYSCVPSNTKPASILVHILDGKSRLIVGPTPSNYCLINIVQTKSDLQF